MITQKTYQELINIFGGEIVNTCVNIYNYGSIAPAYKPFTHTVGTASSNYVSSGGNVTLNNPVVEYTVDQFNGHYDAFLNSIGVTAEHRNKQVSDANLIHFIHDLALFYLHNVCFAMSVQGNGASGDRIRVFIPHTVNGDSVRLIDVNADIENGSYTISMDDLNNMLYWIMYYTKANVRVAPIYFTYGIW